MEIYIKDKSLNYRFGKDSAESLAIIDTSGRLLVESKNLLSIGKVDLNKLTKGFYLAVFKTKSGKVVTKKFILE